VILMLADIINNQPHSRSPNSVWRTFNFFGLKGRLTNSTRNCYPPPGLFNEPVADPFSPAL
jgi:hypothetical protein